ncbi:MAG: succinyl-CoA synthetase subunit alpha, partial [Actinomycetota bacterium]
MIVGKGDRVLVHGMTGRQGGFWTTKMADYGTNVVGGVSPKKAGTEHLGLPVFGSAVEAAESLGGIDVSVLFVPPAGARPAT